MAPAHSKIARGVSAVALVYTARGVSEPKRSEDNILPFSDKKKNKKTLPSQAAESFASGTFETADGESLMEIPTNIDLLNAGGDSSTNINLVNCAGDHLGTITMEDWREAQRKAERKLIAATLHVHDGYPFTVVYDSLKEHQHSLASGSILTRPHRAWAWESRQYMHCPSHANRSAPKV